MSTFESQHPRAGGTGPGRTQFAAKSQTPSVLSLEPESSVVKPMDEAPQDGEVIEGIFEGAAYDVYWSDRADDGSPYGVSGWKDQETGFVMLDLEGWREKEVPVFIDEEGDRAALAAQQERYDQAQKTIDQERAAAQAQAMKEHQEQRHPMLDYMGQSFLNALREDINRR